MAIPFDLHRIARTENFQQRVSYFMSKGAVAVIAELLTILGHDLRVTYSNSVLGGSASVFNHALAALTNSTLSAAADPDLPADGGYGISDNDLEFAVNEMWNAMSGVETG